MTQRTEPRSIAELFHERTKYDPESIGQHPGLDPNTQPEQFKAYTGADVVSLRDALKSDQQLADDQEEAGGIVPQRTIRERLARLLYFTNGVTAVAQYGLHVQHYRAAPSAGGLYPTEIYLLVRRDDEIPAGVYNLDVRDLSLNRAVPLGLGPEGKDLWQQLSTASLGQPAVGESDYCLVFTTIFFRSAWRYQERAYRRIMLDTGHVFGNCGAIAPREGFVAAATTGFIDEEINRLLGISSAREGAVIVAPLVEQARWRPELAGKRWMRSSPFQNVQAHDGQDLLALLHERSSVVRRDLPLLSNPLQVERRGVFDLPIAGQRIPLADVPDPLAGTGLTSAIVERRSTRQLSQAGLSFEEFSALLRSGYPDADTTSVSEQGFQRDLLSTWLAVHNVEGLEPGVYALDPETMTVSLVEAGDRRRESYFLALHQELSGNAACVVFHTADLRRSVELYGDRVYRTLHMDAGHIGERLNLAAIALGLGVSGIGGFFDNYVNELLAIPDHQVCVYITCLGRPG